jgi:hypothetical protein
LNAFVVFLLLDDVADLLKLPESHLLRMVQMVIDCCYRHSCLFGKNLLRESAPRCSEAKLLKISDEIHIYLLLIRIKL